MRNLKATEIECRVGQAGKTPAGKAWMSVLLYKNARVDMSILDEEFGVGGWTREHMEIGGVNYCRVGVFFEGRGWVYREDAGVESNVEKEKGAASDAFKRACVNWGIGRELYTAPKIFVQLHPGEYREDPGGKITPKVGLSVASINYVDGEISALALVDERGATRYEWARK